MYKKAIEENQSHHPIGIKDKRKNTMKQEHEVNHLEENGEDKHHGRHRGMGEVELKL